MAEYSSSFLSSLHMQFIISMTSIVSGARRRGDRPPSYVWWGDIYLVNMGRQGILCLLAVRDGVGVAT